MCYKRSDDHSGLSTSSPRLYSYSKMKVGCCLPPIMRRFLTVCVAVVVTSCPSLQVSARAASEVSGKGVLTDTISRQADTTLYSMTATASRQGVLVQWRSSFEIDNIGFNVYRLRKGHRTKVNREIIAGSAFIAGENKPLRAGYSYSCFDPSGTADSIYSTESL